MCLRKKVCMNETKDGKELELEKLFVFAYV